MISTKTPAGPLGRAELEHRLRKLAELHIAQKPNPQGIKRCVHCCHAWPCRSWLLATGTRL